MAIVILDQIIDKDGTVHTCKLLFQNPAYPERADWQKPSIGKIHEIRITNAKHIYLCGTFEVTQTYKQRRFLRKAVITTRKVTCNFKSSLNNVIWESVYKHNCGDKS